MTNRTYIKPGDLGHPANDETPEGSAGFLLAAHEWAGDMLREHGHIPGVMLFGRGQGDDRELLFVFPSSNDLEQYTAAIKQQADDFHPEVAVWVNEGVLGLERQGEASVETPCALFFWRERVGPVRAQYAVVAGEVLGAANSMLGEHHQPLLDVVFPPPLH